MSAVLRRRPRGWPPRPSSLAPALELLFDPGTFKPVRSAVGDGVIAGSGRSTGAPSTSGRRTARSRAARSARRAARRSSARSSRPGARRAGRRLPALGRRAPAGGRRGAARLLAIFRAQARRRAADLRHRRPVRGRRGVLAGARRPDVMAGPDARMFLTGPKIIERVTREIVTALELGGPKVHAQERRLAPRRRRRRRRGRPRPHGARPPARQGRRRAAAAPARGPGPGRPVADVLPDRDRQVYDVRDVAAHLVDGGVLLELAPRWARNMVVGLARIDGRADRRHRQPAAAPRRHARRRRRRQGRVVRRPLRPLRRCRSSCSPTPRASCPGVKPGARGRVCATAPRCCVRSPSRPRPRVTVTLRQAYGGAHIVMNCRDLGHDLTFAWPSARIGVMGATQAIEIIHRREIAAGADPAALAAAYEAEHLPVERRRGGRLRRRDRRADARPASASRALGGRTDDTAPAARGDRPTRNATEDAILAAARELLGREGFDEQVTIDRDRAARVRQPHDGLLLLREQARGHGPPHPAGVHRHVRGRRRRTSTAPASRARELRLALARFVAVVNRNGRILHARRELSRRATSTCPPSGSPTSRASSQGAEARIARDQERGIAPDDISAADRRAGAVRDGRAPHRARARARPTATQRVDPRARRAVVARGLLAPGRRRRVRRGRVGRRAVVRGGARRVRIVLSSGHDRRHRRPQGVIAAVDVERSRR